MKRLFLVLTLATLSNMALAYDNSFHGCQATKVFWDSDGHSPYVNYAECVGLLQKAEAGTSQTVTALTNEEAGGVGNATFKCNEDGTWTIDDTLFNTHQANAGYCAD